MSSADALARLTPLLAYLCSSPQVLDMSEFNIRFSGFPLLSEISSIAECDGLAVLPYSVARAKPKEARIGVVLPRSPCRPVCFASCGTCKVSRSPAADRFATPMMRSFEELKHLTKRQGSAVV